MNFSIINNSKSENNHSARFRALFQISDTILIASPFLMGDFSDFFCDLNCAQLKKIHLITTLSPKSFDQINKIGSLVSFIEVPAIKDGKLKSQISLNNKLHGKIYIFKKEGEILSAILTSANFTDSGLSRNHEWGVEITDSAEILKLEKSILDSIEVLDLSHSDIFKMQLATNEFLKKQPDKTNEIDLKLINLISSKNWITGIDDTVNYWLKPIGVSGNPVSEDRLFTDLTEHLHFEKRRPNGVKPNDILIAYGVGTTKILSIYKATSSPLEVTQEDIDDDNWLERWPWYVEAENLTTKFGGTWAQHDLFIGSLKNDFLKDYPTEPITSTGNQTLGALNFGKDKVRLAPEFATYIIDKVFSINQ